VIKEADRRSCYLTLRPKQLEVAHSTATGLSTLGITAQRACTRQAELVPNWCKDNAFVSNLGAE